MTEEGFGLTLVGIVQAIFIILKLAGGIDWSWWWVFSPALIFLGLLVVSAIVAVMFGNKEGL